MENSIALLKDKIILITGSSTGIGAAIARLCVKAGAKVMLHGLEKNLALELVEELGADIAGYILTDLTDIQADIKIVKATLDKFGKLDGLVNNAGISPRHNIDSVTYEELDRVMRVNFYAALLISKEAINIFRKEKLHGSIVNIGSLNAHCGQTDLLIYSCTKGALMTMTRNLADALGIEQIRVNQLNVGWTATPNEIALKKKEGLPDDWQNKIPKLYAPSGKLLSPEQVASHVVFWLSDYSAPVSGAVYEVEQYPVIGRNLINHITLAK